MYLQETFNLSRVSFCYQKTHHNNKVDEFLFKYMNFITKRDSIIEFSFTQDSKNKMDKNTNLKTIHNG